MLIILRNKSTSYSEKSNYFKSVKIVFLNVFQRGEKSDKIPNTDIRGPTK